MFELALLSGVLIFENIFFKLNEMGQLVFKKALQGEHKLVLRQNKFKKVFLETLEKTCTHAKRKQRKQKNVNSERNTLIKKHSEKYCWKRESEWLTIIYNM